MIHSSTGRLMVENEKKNILIVVMAKLVRFLKTARKLWFLIYILCCFDAKLTDDWNYMFESDFSPNNRSLLGLNVGGGVHVKLRLRRPNRDLDFFPFHQVLDTMLHELCHNVHGPHNANFYKLWDELRKVLYFFFS